MPIRHLTATSDPKDVAKAIVEAHPALLSPELVSLKQVERLIRRLVEHRSSAQRSDASQAAGARTPNASARSSTL